MKNYKIKLRKKYCKIHKITMQIQCVCVCVNMYLHIYIYMSIIAEEYPT